MVARDRRAVKARAEKLAPWEQFAARTLFRAMDNAQLTYEDLAARLTVRGFPVVAKTLANKLRRGKFPMSFGMLVLHAMGQDRIHFGEPRKADLHRKSRPNRIVDAATARLRGGKKTK